MGRKSALKRWLAALGTYHEQIKIAFTIFASIWILGEYKAKQHESRVERSAAYMKQGGGEKVTDAEIKSALFRLQPDFKARLDKIPKGDKAAFEAFSIENGKRLEEEIWRRLQFYNGLAVCVNSGLCDSETACSGFNADIRVYFENYGPYFSKYQNDYQHDALRPVREMMEQYCDERPWWRRWF
jgi:hypothetical protein